MTALDGTWVTAWVVAFMMLAGALFCVAALFEARSLRAELAQREDTADRWAAFLDRKWRELRDREAMLAAAERRFG